MKKLFFLFLKTCFVTISAVIIATGLYGLVVMRTPEEPSSTVPYKEICGKSYLNPDFLDEVQALLAIPDPEIHQIVLYNLRCINIDYGVAPQEAIGAASPGKIIIDKTASQDLKETLLHEMTHSYTRKKVLEDLTKHPETAEFISCIEEETIAYYTALRVGFNSHNIPGNTKEAVRAWVIANPHYQKQCNLK